MGQFVGTKTNQTNNNITKLTNPATTQTTNTGCGCPAWAIVLVIIIVILVLIFVFWLFWRHANGKRISPIKQEYQIGPGIENGQRIYYPESTTGYRQIMYAPDEVPYNV